jgi:hypothetical protein
LLEELGLQLRPSAADIPDIGAIGVIDTPLAQPGEGGIQYEAGGHLADPVPRFCGILGHAVHDDRNGMRAFEP